MNPETNSSRNAPLFAFFAGLALGGVAVALTTPRRGKELRKDIADLGGRVKGTFSNLAHRRPGIPDAADEMRNLGSDLRAKAASAWQEVKESVPRAGEDLKAGATNAAKDLRG